VTEVEGLRSSKAIAFINNSLEAKTYFTVRTSPPQATNFSTNKSHIEIRLNVPLKQELGEKKWTN
jgi:hypothetical protein